MSMSPIMHPRVKEVRTDLGGSSRRGKVFFLCLVYIIYQITDRRANEILNISELCLLKLYSHLDFLQAMGKYFVLNVVALSSLEH